MYCNVCLVSCYIFQIAQMVGLRVMMEVQSSVLCLVMGRLNVRMAVMNGIAEVQQPVNISITYHNAHTNNPLIQKK